MIRLLPCAALLLPVILAAAGAPRPLRPGTELFVDDARIARRENVTRTTHPARKPPRPVLEPDRPWEAGRVYVYGTVHRDAAGRFHLWYTAPAKMLYATSPDGLNWTKPELDVATHEGRRTNIVFPVSHGGAVLVDEAESDPARRYKALIAEPIRVGGFSGYFSADGIHWTRYGHDRILTVGSEIGQVVRDPATGKYLGYIRPYPPRHFPKSTREKRLGAVVTSDDFVHWSEMKVVLEPDAVDDAWVTRPGQRTEFYGMSGFPYGQSYLGLVPVFRVTGIHETVGQEQSRYDGPMHGELITSRDGLTWARMAERTPIIPSGPDFDRSVMHTGVAPLIVGDEVWHYYTGINTTHGGPIPPKRITVCLAKWRLDGFVSLDAGPAEGVIETTPLAPPGGSLEVNADCRRGTLVVEALDAATGAVVPGYAATDAEPVTGDQLRAQVRWKNYTALPADRSVRLRFRLRSGQLYSYTLGAGK